MMLRMLLLMMSTATLVTSQSCNIPDGGQGTCVAPSKCQAVVRLLSLAGSDPTATSKLRKLVKACSSFTILACCESVEDEFKEIIDNRTCDGGHCLLPSIDYCGKTSLADRIVGGQDAKLGSWPWMVAVFGTHQNSRTINFCGGTLISKRYILSAAHCFHFGISVSYVRVGDLKISTNPDCLKGSCGPSINSLAVESIIIHPDYKQNCEECNDIALIRLAKDITMYEDYVVPICLPINVETTMGYSESQFQGLDAKAAGWGSVTGAPYGINQADHLQEVQLPVNNSHPYCQVLQRKFGILDPKMILCAGGEEKDICKGDSGGPLVLTNRFSTQSFLVGLTSVGPRQCGLSSTVAMYTNVIYHLNWIIASMRP